MDTAGNSPGLKPGECESILDITRTAIANGHVDLVQRQFNKLVDRVIDLSTRIIEATSSAMEDREVTFVRHVDPLICPSGMLARASSTTHPREGSSSRGSSVRSSVGHLGKPRGSLVSNGAFGRREWSLPLSDNGSGNGNKNSVLKRRLSTVSKDGSVGSSQRRMSIGADLRRRSSVSHLARRETYSTDEFGISHNTCPGRLQSSATGIGVCSEERHDGPPPVTEEELTDEEVKATLAVLEEGHPSLQTYYELLHVHSCKDALHCVTEAHTKGALIISSQAKPENVRDVQEEPQEHSLSNFSVCFVSALFSHYSDRCGKSQGASLDNHRETTVKLESAEENSLGGSKGGSTEEAGNIFICTNAFFQKQPSPGKQTARPLTHLVREVTTTPKESLNSSESSVDGKGNPSEKNGGPTNFVPVEWHPARSAELALRNDSIVMPRTNERRDVIKVSNECGSEWCTNGDSTPGGNAFVVNCTASTYALFTGLPLLSSSGISGSGADANCCIAATETAVPMAAVESSLEGGDSSASTTHTGKSGVLGCETARELSGSRLTIELRITKSPSLQSVQALQVVQMATWRRPITLLYGNVLHRSVAARTAAVSDLSTPLPVVLCGSKRGVKLSNPIGKQGSQHYGTEPKLEAGKDVQIKHTEMYDGYTDDFGVFKEGPPMTLRLEYVRSPDHGFSQQLLQKDIWSPFQVNANMMIYTPLYYDWQGFSSRDYWGHRSGTNPGSKVVMGHYRRVEERSWGYRIMVNHKPQKRVPKWLACIVHLPRKKKFVGFFLYANGAYVAELLTYKQLPRICYNKRSSSGLPTIGQTVSLSEVTYGKELHSVEMYPGHGGVICRASGAAAVVLRGAEPNLVPLLLPSKEVRLFDNECHAVFGRRAGVMYRYQRNFGKRNVEEYMPHRPKVHSKTKRVSSHPAGGGNGGSSNLLVPLDWRIHPRNCVKTKYWLSGYILRGRQYNKGQTVADIKSKTYSWANRDPVYR